MIVENKDYRNKTYIYNTREEAGEILAKLVEEVEFEIVYIIPNGGLPVGLGLLLYLETRDIIFDLLIVKKVHVPWSTEAGMGAITPDGQIFLNERMVGSLSINVVQLKKQINETKIRIESMRSHFELDEIIDPKGKNAIIIDDGIASGFSMLAGASWIRKLGAKKVYLGSPTAPLSSISRLKSKVDGIFCVNIREGYSFAVADAYKNWYDLSQHEAENYVKKLKEIGKKK